MKKVINTDYWDDDSVVVNFDLVDTDDNHTVVGQAGYVHVRMDDGYVVTVFNADGDVVSEMHIPFEFKG